MSLFDLYSEREELPGGARRHIQYLKRIAYRENGDLRQIVNDWTDSGIPERPHIITAAPFLVSAGQDGMRRIHPTRELDRYFEMGAPYVKVGGVWTKAPLGTPSRNGNLLQWTTANANMYIRQGGHFIKLGILLKNGWIPADSQFAFPVGLNGLTRQGTTFYADGEPVMSVRAPVVYDYANDLDVRPITSQVVQVNGQWYVLFTLPSLAGMSQPLIDPTLTLQPAAAAGLDAFINSTAATTNYGTNVKLGMGSTSGSDRRTLIKFDLTSLPAAAVISSATFSLYLIDDYSSNTRTVRVYRQLRAWVEAQATWNIYATGSNWATAGGFGAADCEQSDIGNLSLTATESQGFKNWALTPTTKTGLDLGNGWLLKADTENEDLYQYASSDNAGSANRPKLVIEYTVPKDAINPLRNAIRRRRSGSPMLRR